MLEGLKKTRLLFIENTNETTMAPLFGALVKEIYYAATLEEAQAHYVEHTIDFIISDVCLANENGLEFIQYVREHNSAIPIVILSAHTQESVLLQAIPLQLSGYITKPLQYDRLIETLRDVEHKIELAQHKRVSIKNDISYDSTLKVVVRDGKIYPLNKKESLFFDLLARYPKLLITKEMIQDSVWEYHDMSDSALNNFIMRLRKRFGKDLIYTIPDIGYRLIG